MHTDPRRPDRRRHRVTREEVRAFAASVGERGPVHHDVEGAAAAGHPDLLAPPTYLFTLALRRGDAFGWVDELGLDMGRALHGEQSFVHHRQVHAGDLLAAVSSCEPVETRSGWHRLHRTTVVRRAGEVVAELRTTLLFPDDGEAGPPSSEGVSGSA